jgi:hemoglobin
MSQATDTQSLYERLGGAEKIASIAADIVARHRVNPLIKTRFEDSDYAALTKNVADFFSMGSGGPANYEGRDMPTAHKGMNLNERELVTTLDDVLAALDAHEVDPVSRNEVLAILWSLKDEVLFQ